MDWNFASQIIVTGISVVFLALILLYVIMKLLGRIFTRLETAEVTPQLKAPEEARADMREEVAAITGAIHAYLEKPRMETPTEAISWERQKPTLIHQPTERKWISSRISEWRLTGRKELVGSE